MNKGCPSSPPKRIGPLGSITAITILSFGDWIPRGHEIPVKIYEPGSKLPVLGMVIQPLIGNPYNGYINPYYWVDDHPLLYGNNGSFFHPGTYENTKTHRGNWCLEYVGIQISEYRSSTAG